MLMTRTDRFESSRHPLLAAVATNTARPGALLATLGVLTALALLVAAAAAENSRFVLAMVVQAMVGLLALVASPLLAAQQIFSDRQAGALDQHRLARRTPWEMLTAYVLGPTWVLLALMLVSMGLTALFARPAQLPSVLGYGALAMAAVVAWSVGGVSLALSLDRTLPLNQAGGVGVLGPVLRLPVYGVMAGADRAHTVIGLAAFEALLLALATRNALRRLARDEDSLDRSVAPSAALFGAAAVTTLLGAARWHGAGYSRAFSVFAAVALAVLTLMSIAPSAGAVFRAWVANAEGTARRLRGDVALAAVLAGASVLGARALAGALPDAQTLLGALFATALVGVFGAARVLRFAGFSRAGVAGVITAAAVLPVISWVASQIGPHGATTTVGSLASALGAPFVAAEGPWDIGVRAVLCVGVAAGSAVTVERALRRARADAQAKLG
jgi:hypothetical protein